MEKKNYEGVVLIFGTFNPMTNAHIQMGLLAAKALPDYRVVYIPSKNRFLTGWKGLKKSSVLDDDIRVRLMQEAVDEYGFIVDNMEITGESSGYTYETVEIVRQKYGTENVYLCMGTDKFDEIDRWFHAKELFSENRYLIIERDGNTLDSVIEESEIASANRDRYMAISNDEYDAVSASMVREAYVQGRLEDVKDYIPANVYAYLAENEEVYQ